VTLVSAILVLKVNVNSDMTKYLPDSSVMKKGLDILTSQFDASAMSVPDVKIMISNLEDSVALDVASGMKATASVEDVSLQHSGKWTLFSLTVPKSVDQKELAASLAAKYGGPDTVTRTSQDGNTPDPIALLVAIIALVVILFLMCRSWIEPFLLLLTCGMAVVVNVGTNAFLPSVSITTNSIVGVLQLVLSIDYSIILLSRYRQVREEISDIDKALSAAIRSSLSPVLSSALTTIVGLLMLCFMKLKIGADLGGVLAKGVICSLVFTYTALPGLIRFFDRRIVCCHKFVPSFNTDRLARAIEKLSVPLSIAFVLIFAGSYILKDRTPMHFSTNVPSKIDEIFPPQNAIVLLYDNEDSLAVIPVLDEVAKDSSVLMAVSYSGLMQRSLPAGEMVSFIKGMLKNEMAAAMVGEMPDLETFLTEDNLKILYYLARNEEELKITFPQLIAFVEKESAENELFVQMGGEQFAEKIKALKFVMNALKENVPEIEVDSSCIPQTVPEQNTVQTQTAEPADSIAVAPIDTVVLQKHRFDDKEQINVPMSAEQLSEFMGSSKMQARMVFSLAKKKKMTPLEFSRFLCNDIFSRKTLSGMISQEQKQQLASILSRMEIADKDVAPLVLSQLDMEYPDTSAVDSVAVIPDTIVSVALVMPVVPEQKKVRTAEDIKLELLSDLVNKPRALTSAQMTSVFRRLGESVDSVQTSLLYAMYGSKNDYDPSWRMSLEEMLGFAGGLLGEDILKNSGFSDKLESMRGKSHSIAAIVTNLPDESEKTERFIRSVRSVADKNLKKDYYLVGESVMFCEMKDGFASEMLLVTVLTILAIFTIVAITFRSALTALILVMTVMSAVFINVCVSGIGGGSMLYLANLIVQSILMGATIDYGILFTNYYKQTLSLKLGFRGSIQTIMTSGLIIVIVPGIMSLAIDDAMISPIVKALSIGTFSAVVMIMFFLPAVLHTFRKIFKK